MVTTRVTTRAYPDLKTWREAQHRPDGHPWSQRDAARFLGISQTYYNRLERRLQAAPGRQARKLMEQTGVSLEVLVGAAE